MEETAAKIITEAQLSFLTEAASWAPKWKVISNLCLVVENILVLVGLVLIFGKEYLTEEESYSNFSNPEMTYSSNGTLWYSLPSLSGEVSPVEEGVWAYSGGSLILFSRLVHTIGLLAAAQSKGHLQSLSTSKLSDLRSIQEDA